MREDTIDGIEWACVACGHRDYGAGFELLDYEQQAGRREPRHGGSSL